MCIKQDGAQWNVYQFALIADALKKKKKSSEFSRGKPPQLARLFTCTHALAHLTGIFLISN